MPPRYLTAFSDGSLLKLSSALKDRLNNCDICPRKCRVNRLKEEVGFCKTGSLAQVYSYMAHHGEEHPVSGSRGSGTIFF